jgi:hypothetical protein
MLNRRTLLRTAALVLPAVGLAGCGMTANVPAAVVTAATDAELIAAGLAAIVPGIAGIPTSVNADIASIAAAVQTYAAEVKAMALALAGDVTAAVALPSVKSIETAVNSVLTMVAGLPIPPPYSTYIQEIAVMLPVVEAAVGISGAPAHQRLAQAVAGSMSVATARASLSKLPKA